MAQSSYSTYGKRRLCIDLKLTPMLAKLSIHESFINAYAVLLNSGTDSLVTDRQIKLDKTSLCQCISLKGEKFFFFSDDYSFSHKNDGVFGQTICL
jgi:hypothetical protein